MILAQAVQHLPHNVKIWITAANLEHEMKIKKRVLRKGEPDLIAIYVGVESVYLSFCFPALEQIPNSVLLWKHAISLETSQEDARILLRRAVELLPHSVELWLALARLETPQEAQKVLNAARKAAPTSHEIWIAAARLTEQQKNSAAEEEAEKGIQKPKEILEKELRVVDSIIEKAVEVLRKNQVILSRDQWLAEAEKCEGDGSPRTSEAIVKATVDMDVDEEDRETTWVSDVEAALSRGKVVTARAILAYALKVFPDKRGLWRRAADLEKAHGTRYALIYCNLALILLIYMLVKRWRPFWLKRSSTVLNQKCSGLCPPRRNGWQAISMVLAQYSRRHSMQIRRASKFGLQLSSLSRRMARGTLLVYFSNELGLLLTRSG